MPQDREAHRAYMRDYRAKKAPAKPERPLRTVPAARDDAESATALVEAELCNYKSAAPSLRAAALAMARILDDMDSVPQQPAAAGRLQSIMAEIRASAPQQVSKLTALRGGRGA